MANTSSRTLRLLSLLQAHRHWDGPELAGRLGVSVRTLRRDIDRLRELGYPVQARRGVDGGYELAPGAVLPPLVLDDDEAVALAVGVQAAAQGAVAGIGESSVRALTKLVRVMPPGLRRRVEALRSMTVPASWPSNGEQVDPAALTALAQASRDAERVRFPYTSAGGAPSDRHVEPYRLVPLGRRWYLVAYDLDRQDWRTFRLDRCGCVVGTGVAFRPRALPADDAATFVRSRVRNLPETYTVQALVRAPRSEVLRRLGRWATVEDAGAGSCTLRMATDSLDWAAMALGTTGADFTVVEPPELLDHLRDWAVRFSAATAAPPS